ncbi:hypothetical protein Drose_11185 [Dactylosporangium roseum]|uniref:Flavin reductase n=1 Tax=Dactylosporangium roseum TaxID=47989 RepID=A0ABY5ZAW0_9ACTN|nr:hypothetical protein [Dactylosporangium roseum]UWZ38731.1 hypothetical protein Drose_11185 [Dactylosporangium roseum]
MTVAHIPARPTWRCTGCAEPWPCATKRQQLIADHGESPAELRTLMALRVADAAEDLRQYGAEQLWNRFLGWLPAPGQRPAIRLVANPPLGGYRRQPPSREQADPREPVTTSPAPSAGSGPTRIPPPRRSRRGTR